MGVNNDVGDAKKSDPKVDPESPADPFQSSPEGGAVGGSDSPDSGTTGKEKEGSSKTGDESESDTATATATATAGKKKDGKKSVEKVFPVFKVFSSPVKESSTANGGAPASDSIDVSTTNPKKRRSSSSSGGNFVCNDPYKPPEMSPEATLMEFIATSASFHGVKKQEINQLEWDILKVFTNNVMPANAAAWYMAKRRFYINNSWENQLLPFLLRKYPDKFYVRNQTVEFLDVYSKDVARKRMHYLINQGLYAYFSHKADEYGVYFFDPFYYENTEPFHANLRLATNTHNGHKSKLIPSFFNQFKKQFVFTQHSPYLVSISQAPTKMKVNITGIIVKMYDSNYGIVQFPSGAGTEKALFCTKALYTDGWQYKGDPLKLDAVKFDGYMIQNNGGNSEYTWYAVLVWGGRKPSPKFCATLDDLMRHRSKRPFPLPEPGSGDGKANPEKMEQEIATPVSPSKKS